MQADDVFSRPNAHGRLVSSRAILRFRRVTNSFGVLVDFSSLSLPRRSMCGYVDSFDEPRAKPSSSFVTSALARSRDVCIPRHYILSFSPCAGCHAGFNSFTLARPHRTICIISSPHCTQQK